MALSESDLLALRGHRFPGGHYRIGHWENFLLTDCTGAEQLPDKQVHPIVLFHAPILGCGMTITKLFELGGVSGAGSVGLDGYDWEYFRPLREEVDYRVEGEVTEVERRTAETGEVFDRFVYRIEMFEGSELAARITNRWRFRR